MTCDLCGGAAVVPDIRFFDYFGFIICADVEACSARLQAWLVADVRAELAAAGVEA